MNIIEAIDSYSYSEKIAHKYKDSTLTFRDLKFKSDALATYIINKLPYDKSPIIVYGHKSSLMVICFLASVKSGHPYIPVDTSIAIERLNEIIKNSNAKLLLSTENLEENSYDLQLLNQEDIMKVLDNKTIIENLNDYYVKDNEPYYIIYTSGSTGTPKGVVVSFNNLVSFVKWGKELANEHDNRIFLNQAPFSFDLSVMDLYLSLSTGSTLYSIDKHMISNMKELFYNFSISNITTWVSTPSFVELCLSSAKFNKDLLPNLKQMLFCGEVLDIQTVKSIKDRFETITITNTYGPTEATVAITGQDITNNDLMDKSSLPVGICKEDCEILIMKDGNVVPEGETGEIIIAGDSVALGYLNNPAITERSFFTIEYDNKKLRAYRTGDEGYLINNNLHYIGRLDQQIKLNGYRIDLGDIESNIKKLEYIENAAVIPAYKKNKIVYLVGMIIVNNEALPLGTKVDIRIKNDLSVYLPDYMIPRKIVIKESLPLNANGKLNKKQLMEEYNNDSL